MRLHSIRDLWLRMNQKKGNNLIMNENFTTAKGSVQCSEKDELNITKMHHAFADIRGSLDVNRYHLEQIIKVLYGNVGDDEDISKQPKTTPDPLPHLCHLSVALVAELAVVPSAPSQPQHKQKPDSLFCSIPCDSQH